jgi:hypothetical protein
LQGGYSRNPFYPLDGAQERTLRSLLEKSNWSDPEHALDGIEDAVPEPARL